MDDAVSTSPLIISDDGQVLGREGDSKLGHFIDQQPSVNVSSLNYSLKMLVAYGREGCFVLAIIFTVYAALQSSPLKIRIASQPKPFFPRNSPVTDYYWGNVQHAFERMQDSDVAFMLYYAPWDAASMDARWEFETTARYYQDQVFFVAINCWWSEGECRRRFPKIHSFPVLIGYRNSGKGVQFHGPHRAPHLVAFLNDLINPLNVVRSTLDIFRLQSKHSAVVIGFFNFNASPQPPGFISFYIAAMEALEKDPGRDIAFAVISSINDAQKFGMNATGTIHLHLWNSILAYPFLRLSSTQLLQWIFKRNQMIVHRLTPPGVKSQMLSEILESSPTIIMMTPRLISPSFLDSPYEYLIKEIALDYFNCNTSSRIEMIIQVARMKMRELKLKERSYKDNYNKRRNNCNETDLAIPPIFEFSRASDCCQTLRNPGIDNSSKPALVCEICSADCSLKSNHELSLDVHLHSCCTLLEPRHYVTRRSYNVCCFKSVDMMFNKFTLTTTETTFLSTQEERRQCLLYNHPQLADRLFFPQEQSDRAIKSENFTGLSCATNITLKFAVMDSLSHGIFFDRLGVDLTKIPSRSAVAILDNNQESHYILDGSLTRTTLREFISNFTMGTLPRYLRSARPIISSTMNDVLTTGDTFSEDIEVLEVCSNNFYSIIHDTKDVVLLFYTPSCAFCKGIAHVYLSAARYFQAAKDIVFARINASENDLAWKFTVNKFPTILFFPANQRLESYEYPDNLPITVSNLIHFVLLHAKLELRVRMALSLCTAKCIFHNRRQALDKIHVLLRHHRVLDGRFKSAINFLLQTRETSDHLYDRNQYRIYAEGIVRDMCEIKVQLSHARTLHLVLFTSMGERLSPRQLDELTSSHDDFKKELRGRWVECQLLSAKVRNAFNNGPKSSKRSRPVR